MYQTHRYNITVQQNHLLYQQVEAIESFVLPRCDADAYGVITSTPVIGKILGMTILLATGPIERFPNPSSQLFLELSTKSDR